MRSAVEIAVDDLVGLPWVGGGRMVDGRLPLGGIDCWGTVTEVRRRAGLATPDPWGLGQFGCDIDPDGLPAELDGRLVEIPAPEPWCVVKMRSPYLGGHGGVYLPDKTVLHTERRAGTVRVPFHRLRRRVIALLRVMP